MTKFDDEVLMAYADGALDPAQAAEVKAFLARDAKAAQTVRMFQESGRLAAGAFEGILHEAVPDRLMRAAAGETAEAGSAVVFDLARRRQERRRGMYGRMALPMAAAIALVIGAAGGFGVSHLVDGAQPPGVLTAGMLTDVPEFQEAMESARSGVPVAWPGVAGAPPGEIMPVLTFRNAADDVCREFQTTLATADATEIGFGVACRGADAHWQTEILVAGPTVPHSEAPTDDGIRPAGGDNAALFRRMVDDLIGDDDVISGNAEAELIANGWR